jgi:hypothetical protein
VDLKLPPIAGYLIARLLHRFGMHAEPNTLRFRIFRMGGTTVTISVMAACAVLILSLLWRGLVAC